MSETITATYEDGLLKLDGLLHLESGTRVKLVVEKCDDLANENEDPLAELDRLL